jgi:hypothetical protein
MQKPQKRRKGSIDFERLMDLPGFEKYDDFKEARNQWVERAVQAGACGREGNMQELTD